jgi:tripartite-type tricarboxylate transporter receptor subunit TctC
MKRIAAFLAAASASLVLATTLLAQSAFPVRTVKIIVPFPGGGINDVLARILADKLAIKWSQHVVIENKTGAGGNIGAELAYQAEPDGYYGCARKCLESLSPCA